MSRDIKLLHPVLSSAYTFAADEYLKLYPTQPQPFITWTHRTHAEQEALFKQFPQVTKARGGQSPHNYIPALAFDIAFITSNKKLTWFPLYFHNFAAIIAKHYPSIQWGASFPTPDLPHFQLKQWRTFITK
jgi:peptidoglycan L-alanyl-D-glutamate endopeptidase CwlK